MPLGLAVYLLPYCRQTARLLSTEKLLYDGCLADIHVISAAIACGKDIAEVGCLLGGPHAYALNDQEFFVSCPAAALLKTTRPKL